MSETTKKALATSLKKLLSKKDLSKITIKNITDDCGVNRQTFYYHFQDVYDLLEWIYKNEVINSTEGCKSWQEGLSCIFKYILDNKDFVKNTYHSISQDLLLKFIYNQTEILITKIIDDKAQNMNIAEKDKKIIADFYKYGFVGIVHEWLENGMKDEPKIIIEKLNMAIELNFIRNPLTNQKK